MDINNDLIMIIGKRFIKQNDVNLIYDIDTDISILIVLKQNRALICSYYIYLLTSKSGNSIHRRNN